METLLTNIFKAGKPVTIDEATGSRDQRAHRIAWARLRRIKETGGCINYDSSRSGGQNNKALIHVSRKVEYTEDCGKCSAAGRCPINNLLARQHKYTRAE